MNERREYQRRVMRYGNLMVTELIANRPKNKVFGDWADCKPRDLVFDLNYHAAKLAWAIKDNDPVRVREYAADCGNMAMMALDAYEKQYKPTENDSLAPPPRVVYVTQKDQSLKAYLIAMLIFGIGVCSYLLYKQFHP